jgi:sialate O-acetylesterase
VSFRQFGYLFARDIQQAERVPIGILFTAWGGTVAEAWTSAEPLKTMPDFKSALELPHRAANDPPAKSDENPNTVTVLYNAMIAPLQAFPIKGVIWYQGESNDDRAEKPELREKQFLTLSKSPNTAMAVITDAGDADDIHPARKQAPAKRLALAARALGYGEKLEYSGPLFASMKAKGNEVVSFTHVGSGLVTKMES